MNKTQEAFAFTMIIFVLVGVIVYSCFKAETQLTADEPSPVRTYGDLMVELAPKLDSINTRLDLIESKIDQLLTVKTSLVVEDEQAPEHQPPEAEGALPSACAKGACSSPTTKSARKRLFNGTFISKISR
jgi:hypothetical protein